MDSEVNGPWVVSPQRQWETLEQLVIQSDGAQLVNPGKSKQRKSGFTRGGSEEPRAAQTLPGGHFAKYICNLRWFMENWEADKNIRV